MADFIPMPKNDWNRTIRRFGDVFEGEELSFTFVYTGTKKYKTHVNSCGGCTKSNWQENKLTVKFIPSPISDDLKKLNITNVFNTKKITVKWTDGTEDVLEVNAYVYAQS